MVTAARSGPQQGLPAPPPQRTSCPLRPSPPLSQRIALALLCAPAPGVWCSLLASAERPPPCWASPRVTSPFWASSSPLRTRPPHSDWARRECGQGPGAVPKSGSQSGIALSITPSPPYHAGATTFPCWALRGMGASTLTLPGEAAPRAERASWAQPGPWGAPHIAPSSGTRLSDSQRALLPPVAKACSGVHTHTQIHKHTDIWIQRQIHTRTCTHTHTHPQLGPGGFL